LSLSKSHAGERKGVSTGSTTGDGDKNGGLDKLDHRKLWLDHRKPETTIGSTTGSRFVSGKNLVSTIMFHVKHGG
jgi:hypothetical protein